MSYLKGFSTIIDAKAIVPTDSADNWGSMLHGVLPEDHEIKYEDLIQGKEYDNFNYPSIFKIITDNIDCKVASFTAWEPINTGIIESSILSLYKYSPMLHENRLIKLYLNLMHYLFNKPVYDDRLVKRFNEFIKEDLEDSFKFLYIHLNDIDECGHIHEYKSKNYYKQTIKTDEHLKSIL